MRAAVCRGWQVAIDGPWEALDFEAITNRQLQVTLTNKANEQCLDYFLQLISRFQTALQDRTFILSLV